ARVPDGRVGDNADAAALADLPDEQVPELVADLTGLEAEDEDVDVGRGRLDVPQEAREERRPVDEQIPASGAGRDEVERQLAPHGLAAEDGLDAGSGIRGV